MNMDMYTPESSLNNKYFCIKTQKNLVYILNKKNLTKIPNLFNQKKIVVLIILTEIFYIKKKISNNLKYR